MTISHADLANAIRFLSIDAIEKAKSGHPGLPMGAADIATVLFKDFLQFDPTTPDWINRDRFILSAGHGSMLLYSLLYLTGYQDFSLEELQNFRQYASKTAGHPEYGHGAGIEMTTGPLGQGLSTSVGIALAEAMAQARFGDVIDHYTYVLASDGDLMEGISHEAIGLAGHLKLKKLIVLFDDNHISIDGDISTSYSGSHQLRFEGAGWDYIQIDGHNPSEISKAISNAKKTEKPSLIACRTIIGKGAPSKQNTAGIHGAPLGSDEIEATKKNLGWSSAPFETPQDILQEWRNIGQKGKQAHQQWSEAFSEEIKPIETFLKAEISQELKTALEKYKKTLLENTPTLATRVASQKALEVINPLYPQLIGGSADLTGSNNTKTNDITAVSSQNYTGRYLHYGIREHGMAAAMSGLSLWGGFIPYGGTFLVFSDYMRPSMRLAALMGIHSIYVLTHDSIGLGEDGPTHQPVEHLSSLRAIPNLYVIRPCDAIETAESWEVALKTKKTPTCLALTRQGLPFLRETTHEQNCVSKGAYILKEATETHKVSLYASGSEVSLMIDAAKQLESHGIGTRVISVPCMELFYQQSEEYQTHILTANIKIACEAAISQGWDNFMSDKDAFVGMKTFGCSAPYKHLYQKYGITAEAIVAKVQERV